MIDLAEVWRRVGNIVRFGTVTDTKSADGKALARIKIGHRVSDFLPVMNFGNSYKRHWIPVRPGEQVVVFAPFGDSGGVVLRSIFNRKCREPSGANDTTEVIEYEDGTRISYDTSANELKVDCVGDTRIHIAKTANVRVGQTYELDCGETITIKSGQDIFVEAQNSRHILAQTYAVEANEISLIATSGGSMHCTGGVLTMEGDFRILGNLEVSGTITDAKGDLTHHDHPDAAAR